MFSSSFGFHNTLINLVLSSSQNNYVDNPFTCVTTPPISTADYCHRLESYMNCSPTAFSVASIYLTRLYKLEPFLFGPKSAHKLMMGTLLVATKWLDDKFYSNQYYGDVAGLPIKELNRLEYEILSRLHFGVFVTETSFKESSSWMSSSRTDLLEYIRTLKYSPSFPFSSSSSSSSSSFATHPTHEWNEENERDVPMKNLNDEGEQEAIKRSLPRVPHRSVESSSEESPLKRRRVDSSNDLLIYLNRGYEATPFAPPILPSYDYPKNDLKANLFSLVSISDSLNNEDDEDENILKGEDKSISFLFEKNDKNSGNHVDFNHSTEKKRKFSFD